MSSKKFILSSTELGRVTLNDDPEGWDAVKKQFNRNMKFLGIFRKRTANLKFWGDGLEYCIELFNLKGTEAILNVVVMQKRDYEDAWDLDFEGIGKFNPFKLEWGDDLSPTLSIEFEDSGFHNKFLTRVNMDVNVGDQESIEGLNVGAMPTENIQVHQRSIEENNTFILSENTSYYEGDEMPEPYIISLKGHVLPVEKTEGDTEFVKTPDDYQLITPGLICDFVDQPTAFKINYHIAGSGNAKDYLLILAPNQVGWYIRIFHDEDDLTDYTDTLLHEITGMVDGTNFNYDFTSSQNIQLSVGEALTLVCEFNHGVEGLTPHDIAYTVTDVLISLIQNFNEYVSKCHYRYEFMKRITQLITDQVDCFESKVFGRTDIGYLANGTYWNNVCFSGKQLRAFNDYPIRSFEKSFKSARSIWNVGCGIEKFGTKYKVVVEELPYFFRGDISITLHNVRKVSRDVSQQFTFSEAHVGYEKAEYEQVNGLEEYNNKSKFSTFIKSDDNILDLISPDRADGYGMEFARRKNRFVAQSEDTPYDNEVFTAMVNKDGTLLRTQKNENYSSVLNIQSPTTATNLDITPQRNLLRNGDWVSGCCYKYPTEKLKFLSADKTTDLSAHRTGDTNPVVEQSSVLNSSLISSLWLNLEYAFESDIVPAQIAAIELKPNSLVKFSPFSREQTKKYYYGWILDSNVGGKERSGTFTLLAANINSDRLVIIDPEGIDPSDPTTPLPPGPPGDTEFGFEYSFEHVFES